MYEKWTSTGLRRRLKGAHIAGSVYERSKDPLNNGWAKRDGSSINSGGSGKQWQCHRKSAVVLNGSKKGRGENICGLSERTIPRMRKNKVPSLGRRNGVALAVRSRV